MDKVKFKKEDRKAEIVEETHYIVKRYAEDCAENWINGII